MLVNNGSKRLVRYVKEHTDDIIYYVVIGSLMTALVTGTTLVLFGFESWAKGHGFYSLF